MAKKTASAQSIHKTVAMVKKVDTKVGTVALDREPVQSLNWPAMTMGFKVVDKKLSDKLTEGKKVEIEFKQVGKDYVVTSVKYGAPSVVHDVSRYPNSTWRCLRCR